MFIYGIILVNMCGSVTSINSQQSLQLWQGFLCRQEVMTESSKELRREREREALLGVMGEAGRE